MADWPWWPQCWSWLPAAVVEPAFAGDADAAAVVGELSLKAEGAWCWRRRGKGRRLWS